MGMLISPQNLGEKCDGWARMYSFDIEVISPNSRDEFGTSWVDTKPTYDWNISARCHIGSLESRSIGYTAEFGTC